MREVREDRWAKRVEVRLCRFPYVKANLDGERYYKCTVSMYVAVAAVQP